ncbi:MAG: hypothetical protein FJ398_15565 [Verrucomicrobia bacterium]|nr:hypothetical protein [Verrucomicrobiota bacterium]
MKSSGEHSVRKCLVFLGGTALAIIAVVCVIYLYWFAPRFVVRTSMTNGLELCVVQRIGGPFSYNTGVFYRKPDGTGGWFYYDHEDNSWRRGRVALDQQSRLATVFREDKPVIVFNWETESCSVRNHAFQKAAGHGSPPTLAFWNPFSRRN